MIAVAESAGFVDESLADFVDWPRKQERPLERPQRIPPYSIWPVGHATTTMRSSFEMAALQRAELEMTMTAAVVLLEGRL